MLVSVASVDMAVLLILTSSSIVRNQAKRKSSRVGLPTCPALAENTTADAAHIVIGITAAGVCELCSRQYVGRPRRNRQSLSGGFAP